MEAGGAGVAAAEGVAAPDAAAASAAPSDPFGRAAQSARLPSSGCSPLMARASPEGAGCGAESAVGAKEAAAAPGGAAEPPVSAREAELCVQLVRRSLRGVGGAAERTDETSPSPTDAESELVPEPTGNDVGRPVPAHEIERCLQLLRRRLSGATGPADPEPSPAPDEAELVLGTYPELDD